MTDLRHALRLLVKKPGFTIAVVLTLAIGIGANTAVFNAVHRLLVQDLPFGDADRLVRIDVSPDSSSVSKAALSGFRQTQHVFDGVAAYSGWGFTVTGLGEPRNVDGARVTSDFFDVLRARPAWGRAFVTGDDQVAVVSDAFWRAHYGDTPGPGRSVIVDDTPRQIVGVMPAGVLYPSRQTEIWLPLKISAADGDWNDVYLSMVGRLKPGVTLAQAREDARLALRAVARMRASRNKTYGNEATVRTLRESLTGNLRPTLFLLLAAVGLLLVVACMNVANLTLSRYAGREAEMAVRAAIGAGRGALVRQVLTESVVLALVGGAASLVVAFWCGRLLDRGLGGRLPLDLSRGSWAMLGYAFAVSVATGFIFGLVPALRVARANAGALHEIGRGTTEGRKRRRVRTTMIAAQVALSLILLAGAGLVLRSFWHVVNIDPGFKSGALLTASISPSGKVYGDAEPARLLARNIEERIAALPGVTAVGSTQLMPFSGNNWNPNITVEGKDVPAEREPEVDWRSVTPGFFRAMQIPIVAGRGFTGADGPHAPGVAIINSALAAKVFPGESAIGRRVRTGFEEKDWVTIVGVAGGLRDQRITDPVRPQIFRPHAQYPVSSLVVMVRASGSEESLRKAVAGAIWAVDPQIPVEVKRMDDVIDASNTRPRLFLVMLLMFAAIAIFLSAVGIYGVTFDSVAHRTREIGVRMAFGGRARDIVLLVLREVAGVAAAGTLIGLAGAFAATRLLSAHLYDVSPTDLPTFTAVTVLLTAITLLAGFLPARRASRLDPVEALRHE
jgi:putative ABC transport system permease protein